MMNKLFENCNKYLNESNIMDKLADHPKSQQIINAALDKLLKRPLHSGEKHVDGAYERLPKQFRELADQLISHNKQQFGDAAGS